MFTLSDKTFNTLTKIQKVLLIILSIACVAVEIVFVLAARAIDDMNLKMVTYVLATVNLFYAISLICGYIYAKKGYSKDANKFYKAMMVFYALSTIYPIISYFIQPKITPQFVIFCAKFVILLVLGFGKDLGKKNTWILFYILLALELLTAFITHNADVSVSQKALGTIINDAVSRLVSAGLVGLCIEAKYRDKEARGTK